MMRMAGRSKEGLSKAIKTNEEGQIEVVEQKDIIEQFSGFLVKDTQAAKTAIVQVKKGGELDRGVFLDGRSSKTADFLPIPMVDSHYMLRDDAINEDGIFYADISKFELIRVRFVSSSGTTTVSTTLTNQECPKPFDVPIKYKRITPADNLVLGKFRAIEPLTDITLHEQTRLLAPGSVENHGDTMFDVIETGDMRSAGQTLFGPFARVRLTSGVALLVLL